MVRDDGPGFSDSALDSATKRFWRDDPARSGAGTGLALIVRSIVERHGGTIALRNDAGDAGAVVELDAYSFCCNVRVSCAGAIPNSSLAFGATPLTMLVIAAVPRPM